MSYLMGFLLKFGGVTYLDTHTYKQYNIIGVTITFDAYYEIHLLLRLSVCVFSV